MHRYLDICITHNPGHKMIALAIFFGFLGFSLLVMLIIYKIASMYVHGDFVKLSPDAEEDTSMALQYDFEVKTQDHYVKERQKEQDGKEEGEEQIEEKSLSDGGQQVVIDVSEK